MDDQQLEEIFSYHSPKGDQADRYQKIRGIGRVMAAIINRECPDSREKSLAITNLQQAVMWANASIAINE